MRDQPGVHAPQSQVFVPFVIMCAAAHCSSGRLGALCCLGTSHMATLRPHLTFLLAQVRPAQTLGPGTQTALGLFPQTGVAFRNLLSKTLPAARGQLLGAALLGQIAGSYHYDLAQVDVSKPSLHAQGEGP